MSPKNASEPSKKASPTAKKPAPTPPPATPDEAPAEWKKAVMFNRKPGKPENPPRKIDRR